MMCVHTSRPLSSRVLSYMCLLTSFTDCNSLTNWRSVAHHASSRCHHHRHNIINRRFKQYSTSRVLPLYNSKLLDEINHTDIATKWRFALAQEDHHHDREDDAELISNILVCGDGDLSFSAEIASELDALGIDLYASVLEDESTHNTVYQYSSMNTKKINAFSRHKTLFKIDATTLSTYFGPNSNNLTTFDRIQFNFPHWRGKANNRYNRQLLNDFLQSAATVLSPRGEIHIALCDGQGGCSSKSLQVWKGSWQASLFAAQHGLLLADVSPYVPQYNLSSHRGVDRPFNLGRNPKMHVFAKPNGLINVPRDIQLCCRHELHIVVPEDEQEVGSSGSSVICSMDQILAGDAIETIIQGIVPVGVRVEVPARQVLELREGEGSLQKVAVFLIVYCSEGFPVTRVQADEWRELAEAEVEKYVPLRENRRGRTVSHAFPYPCLHPEIKYRTTGER